MHFEKKQISNQKYGICLIFQNLKLGSPPQCTKKAVLKFSQMNLTFKKNVEVNNLFTYLLIYFKHHLENTTLKMHNCVKCLIISFIIITFVKTREENFF